MQSNVDFIPNFSRHAAKLRELTQKNSRFTWTKEHHATYEALIERFKANTLLKYFDMSKQSFIFTDAHNTGLGTMLAQGPTLESARPIAIASRTTTKAEQRYPQIDLEALGIDFALRRFCNYIVGSPIEIQVITDHKPLCSIFNGNHKGSICTKRIKWKVNQTTYLDTPNQSRHYLRRNKLKRMTSIISCTFFTSHQPSIA